MADPKLTKDILTARRTGTPLVLITTADQWATMDTLISLFMETAAADGKDAPGVLVHDVVHGLRVGLDRHAPSEAARQAVGLDQAKSMNPIETLAAVETRLPGNCVLFMMNAHRHLVDVPTRFLQAVSNLRDTLKRNKRMLVLLAPSLTIPAEWEGDVYALDEPRPSGDELRAIIARQHENVKSKVPDLPMPDEKKTGLIVDALAGLKTFEAEQNMIMSIARDGVDVPAVWERKRKAIANTVGLKVYVGPERFETIGGLDNIKAFYTRYGDGPNRPAGIVFIDEIEKDTAGMHGDNTGVAQRQHKALLTYMQDRRGVRGIIHAGQPGTGKSTIPKALGNEWGVPVIMLNLGDLLDSKVGASEARMNEALKTIDKVCQERALFVATCNDMKGLSPELRARFKNGTFFFDLPNAIEREAVWRIYLAKFGRKLTEQRPFDRGWVPREIEACCDQAHTLGLSLVEAAKYIVPQAVGMKDAVERRRAEAHGAIISASYAGQYDRHKADHDEELVGTGREVDVA